MNRIVPILLFLSVSQLFGQGSDKKSNPSQTLITVNGQPVSTDEFIYIYRKNHQNKPEDFTTPKVEEYLDLYVNFKLKVTEAISQGLDTTQSFQREFEQYRQEIKKPFISQGDDLDRLVKEAYERSTERVRAYHILISLKTDATPADTLAAWNKINDIRNKAVNNEDFQSLAKEFSEDPSAKTNGGDLSYFSAMDMVYPFESAAYNTRIGDVSPIVKTRFGYHIIKVVDRVKNDEVEVSHIMLRANQDNTSDPQNRIFELHDQLKAGAKWDEVCKAYSEDPNSKNNGGKLRPFRIGTFTSAAPEFERTAFSLENAGDFSDPIQTPFGWHIVRLEKKTHVPPFKEVQSSLTRMISRDDRLQISKNAHLDKMKQSLGFVENVDVKKSVLDLADSTLQKGQWSYNFSKTNSIICSIGGKDLNATSFLEYAKKNQERNNQAPKIYLEQLYNKWVNQLLNDAEEEKLIAEKPEFKSILDEYREGILLFTIMESEVWNKASRDSVGQRKFYESNRSKYKAGNRIHARIFSTDDKKILDNFKLKVSSGDTITNQDLRELKSVSNYRAYEKGETKITDKVSWTIGLHETELDGVFFLIDIDQLLPPGIKSFEEARASIISDYQDSLEKVWISDLKKKYPVSINTKGKKIVIKELTSKK